MVGNGGQRRVEEKRVKLERWCKDGAKERVKGTIKLSFRFFFHDGYLL